MRLSDFISSILPRLRKDEVLEDLRITAGELANVVTPAYVDANKYFKSSKFESPEAQEAIKTFYRNYKADRTNKNIVVEIHDRLPNLLKNLQFVSEQNDDLLERDILKDGLTAKKAILLRAAEQLSFISRYSIDLLNYLLVVETLKKGGHAERAAPIIEKKLIDNVVNFGRLLAVYGKDPEDFVEVFDTLPEVVVNEKTYAALAAAYSADKLDPMETLLMSGFEANPIYHIRLIVAEWQADRYKVYKDKKRMLELRLLQLKMMDDKNPDPKIEREIEYVQNRIEGIEFKMAKMEKSVS